MRSGKSRKIKITHIHEKDACYRFSHVYIGKEGEFIPNSLRLFKGYYSGSFYSDQVPEGGAFFIAVRYKKI